MVIVRFAPSPTGEFHIGSLRTALYNFLFAQKNKGKFILRIEDTDRKRYVPGSEQGIMEGLEWTGITYDEGPIRQSQRLSIYQKYAQQLVDEGKAYYCFCMPEELEQQRKLQMAEGDIPRYDRRCRHLSPEDINQKLSNNIPFTIRLKVPETGVTVFKDLLRGEIRVSNNTIEDQVLLKSDGYPTYHLSVVVDDHEMGVTHILRGDEWISSTPKHILLYQTFGWELPTYIHLPPIQRSDKTKKLSKREGATSVQWFKDKGYLPEALVNYLALLGWNPGDDQEMMTMSDMIQKFDIHKLQKAGAAFDPQKLDWFNQHYVMNLSEAEFIGRIDGYITSVPEGVMTNFASGAKTIITNEGRKKYFHRLLMIERQRSHTLHEIITRGLELMEVGEYNSQMLPWKDSTLDNTKHKLEYFKKFIQDLEDSSFEVSKLEITIKEEITKQGWGTGECLWPLRVALSAKESSPGPFELLWALGKEESLKRIEHAIKKLPLTTH